LATEHERARKMDTQNGVVVQPNRILLATDGSEDARLACRVAADLAGRTGAELHVAHAWRHHITGLGYPTVAWTDYSYLDEREARRVLATEVDTVEASGVAVSEPHLLQGPPIDAILDLCDELRPGLLVMGSRGLGPVGRIFLGSVSEGVVHHAWCPVFVVRGGEEAWPPARVVAGDDGSKSAELAARLAVSMGGLYAAEATLVRAYASPPEPIGGWSPEDRRGLNLMRSREEGALIGRAEAIEKVTGTRPGSRVVDADAALALLLVAEEGEERKTLVAMGSRGLGVVDRVRLGSVSTKVLRIARGPVLIHASPTGQTGARDPGEAVTVVRRPVPAPERVIS